MTKKQLKDFRKQLRRQPPPTIKPKPTPPVQAAARELTAAQRIILAELHRFHLDLVQLYTRALHGMMVRGLLEGSIGK
jgi:hypothetical protein